MTAPSSSAGIGWRFARVVVRYRGWITVAWAVTAAVLLMCGSKVQLWLQVPQLVGFV